MVKETRQATTSLQNCPGWPVVLSCILPWAETMRKLPQLAPLLHGGAGAEQHNHWAQHRCQMQSHRQSHTLAIRDARRSILTGAITCRSPSMSPSYCRPRAAASAPSQTLAQTAGIVRELGCQSYNVTTSLRFQPPQQCLLCPSPTPHAPQDRVLPGREGSVFMAVAYKRRGQHMNLCLYTQAHRSSSQRALCFHKTQQLQAEGLAAI